MIRSSPKTTRYQTLYAHLWISGLSIFFCTLLLRAFPYGIPYPDTGSFLANAQTFGLFTPNGNDWARTIPFGALLQFSLLFKNPSFVVTLVHCCLFIVALNLVLWSIRPLFQSPWIPIIITSALLLIEVSLMHVFFYNVILLADAPYAHLVFIGALLVLGSWLRKKPIPLYLGFVTLGLAWFVKPVGIALLPSWGLFAIFGTKGNALQWPHVWWKRATLALLLFLTPTFLWSTRNAVVYGSFASTAMSGSQALASILPFVKDGDTLLKDPEKNQQFMNALRTFEEKFGTAFNTYIYQGTEEIPNPFQTLANLLQPEEPLRRSLGMGFTMNATHWTLALRIGMAHPLSVFSHIFKNYYRLFHIVAILPHDPSGRYKEQLSSLSEEDRRVLYPPDGSFESSAIDMKNLRFLQLLDKTPFLTQTLRRNDLLVMNGIFHGLLLICCLSVLAYRSSPAKYNVKFFHVSIFILMLLSITFFHNLAAAIAAPPLERYALPGEMPFRFAILLTGIILLWGKRTTHEFLDRLQKGLGYHTMSLHTRMRTIDKVKVPEFPGRS